jgi:hypothetical protein
MNLIESRYLSFSKNTSHKELSRSECKKCDLPIGACICILVSPTPIYLVPSVTAPIGFPASLCSFTVCISLEICSLRIFLLLQADTCAEGLTPNEFRDHRDENNHTGMPLSPSRQSKNTRIVCNYFSGNRLRNAAAAAESTKIREPKQKHHEFVSCVKVAR